MSDASKYIPGIGDYFQVSKKEIKDGIFVETGTIDPNTGVEIPAGTYVAAKVPEVGYETIKPINPNASPNARKLLNYLYSIKGKKILSGHHNWIETPSGGMNTVKNTAGIGQYPAVYGMEIGTIDGSFSAATIATHRQNTINAVINFCRSGNGIVTITWHHNYPGAVRSWENVQRYTTQAEFDQIVTPGSTMFNTWMAEVDEMAEYLKQLRDLDIPVLWRPYHEMNGGWFWWGEKNNFVKLWDLLYDRLVNVHYLNNLIWVWGPNAPNGWGTTMEYNNPGIWVGVNKADAFAVDIYNNDYQQKYHDDLVNLTQGKLLGIGENGRMPSVNVLTNQPQWTWFNTWTSNWNDTPSAEKLTIYNDPRVLTADEIAQPVFTGYPGDEIPYVTQNQYKPATGNISVPPAAPGQMALVNGDIYIGTATNTPTDWIKMAKEGKPIMTAPNGMDYLLKVANDGTLSTDPITVVFDDFNRADNMTATGLSAAPAVTGQTWQLHSGWGIKDNSARSIYGFNNDMAIINTGINDYMVSCVMSGHVNQLDPTKNIWETAQGSPQLMARVAADFTTYLFATIENSYMLLTKRIANLSTNLAVVPTPMQNGRKFLAQIQLKGPLVIVFIDGVEKARVTLTASDYNILKLNTYAGLRYSRGTAPPFGPTWDNFKVNKLI